MADFARMLDPGDPMPWFILPRLGGEPRFGFDKLGGRHTLLLAFGSAKIPAVADALALVRAAGSVFNNSDAAFMGLTTDARDVETGRVFATVPFMHFLLDFNRDASALLGAVAKDTGDLRPHWLLIDPALRVVARFPLAQGAQAIAATAAAVASVTEQPAPILRVPRLLDPDLCARLIDHYERQGGQDSGMMRQVGDRTVHVIDHSHKRRRDCEITDEALSQALRTAVERRLVPMIQRAFQFRATRIERYIVACYDASEGGHFNAHRDNTTLGTAHRRFAVTINLNEDYEGGDLRFPEWGRRTYRAGAGGAVVFSCSMLHEATPVTAGRRYATLPFLYDEAAAEVRAANAHALEPAPATAGAG